MINLNKEKFKEDIREALMLKGTVLEDATKREVYEAVTTSIMKNVTANWLATRKTYEDKEVKQAYYLSAEF